jgi:single-strand DNA-binding protein
MADLNKVLLVGRLTRDPELRYTPSNTPATDLGIAVNRNYTTREGERREEVAFVDVSVMGRQAENCCQYLRKGSQVLIEGYLRLDSWEDKSSGEKRSKLRVGADRVQFLDSRRGDQAAGADDEEPGTPRARSAPPNRSNSPASSPPPRSPQASGPQDSGKDIPF